MYPYPPTAPLPQLLRPRASQRGSSPTRDVPSKKPINLRRQSVPTTSLDSPSSPSTERSHRTLSTASRGRRRSRLRRRRRRCALHDDLRDGDRLDDRLDRSAGNYDLGIHASGGTALDGRVELRFGRRGDGAGGGEGGFEAASRGRDGAGSAGAKAGENPRKHLEGVGS